MRSQLLSQKAWFILLYLQIFSFVLQNLSFVFSLLYAFCALSFVFLTFSFASQITFLWQLIGFSFVCRAAVQAWPVIVK
jgi:hypothetical protein